MIGYQIYITHYTENSVKDREPAQIIRGGRSGTGTGFSPSTAVLLYWYHSTSVPYICYLNTYVLRIKQTNRLNLEPAKHWLFGNRGRIEHRSNSILCLTYFDFKGGLLLFCLSFINATKFWNVFILNPLDIKNDARQPNARVMCSTKSVPYTRWFKYDRDKLWLVYTQSVPVIFEPPCIISRGHITTW
jgi:hypothetical protein